MNKTTKFLVDEINNNLRLEKYLASKFKKIKRSQIKKNILSKKVSINGNVITSPFSKEKI
jgi:Pseudouridylate synthases, 23S RNA-specific